MCIAHNKISPIIDCDDFGNPEDNNAIDKSQCFVDPLLDLDEQTLELITVDNETNSDKNIEEISLNHLNPEDNNAIYKSNYDQMPELEEDKPDNEYDQMPELQEDESDNENNQIIYRFLPCTMQTQDLEWNESGNIAQIQWITYGRRAGKVPIQYQTIVWD